jgi:hypothetical protein
VLGPAEILLTYYLGGAFVVLLGWAAYLPDPPLDAGRAQRYLRWSTVAAVVGLAHPALGLAARDIVGQVGQVGQVGHDAPGDASLAPRVSRTATTINVLLAASIVPLAAVVALGLR